MFNLYEIITGAQGGQAIDNLARQFGLSPQQADAAVKSLIPSLSTAFMAKAAQPGGLNEIAGAMADDQHKQAYADPGAAQDSSTQQKGGDIAGSVFGNNAMVGQVIAQASRYTGIPAATLEQMLPVVISVVLGGVATSLHNQGLGGILGQLANSGFGNILGGALGQAGAPAGGGLGGMFGGAPGQAGNAAGGGLGGLFGNILGGFFGGAQHTNPQEPASSAPNPDGMPPAVQAGMDALSKMFQPGVQAHPFTPEDLGAQISSILGGRKP